jgi:hypothetical protein
MNLVVKIQNQLVFLSKMRYIKLLKEGGAAKTYVGKKGGSGGKPMFAYQRGRGGQKSGKFCLHSL